MNPYSVDLRQRIIAAVTSRMSRSEVVRTFQVSAATVRRYLKQQRETGDLTPHAHTGGRQSRIGLEQYPALQEVIAAAPDSTLAETCQHWHQRTGVLVSQATMSRALATIGWTRKKRRLQQAIATKGDAVASDYKSSSTLRASS